MKKVVDKYPAEKVAEICHVDVDKLIEAARMYATAKNAAIIYCLGVTEHHTGTEGVMSLSNLAMITETLAVLVVVLTQSVVRITYRVPAIWVLLRISSRVIRN